MKVLTHPFRSILLAAWTACCLGSLAPSAPMAQAEARKSARLQPTQAKLYKKALDAFEAKKYEDAADILTQILQKQPDNTPSKILLARCLYQTKRMPEAYKLFQQLDLNVLDPEPSYEYGQTALKINEFGVALKAFRNVPNGHPLFDLAGYYGGFCALKSGDYQLALDLLEQAVVLPSKLVKTQKLYVKEAERLLMQKQREDVQTVVTPLPPPAPTPVAPPPASPPNTPTTSVEDDRKSYRFLRAQKGIGLLGVYTLQDQAYGNKAVVNREVKEGELWARAGYDKVISHNRSPHYLVQSELSVKGLEGSSGRLGIMPDARQEQELYLLKKSPSRSLVFADVHAAIEWPIADGNSLGFELGGYVHKSNETGGLMAASPYVSLFLAQRTQVLETLISLSSHARTLEGEMQAVNSRQLARIAFTTPAGLQLGVQGELQEFAYSINEVDGPDWLGQIRAEFGYEREKELELFVGAMFETGQGYRLHNVGETKVLGFDPSNMGGYARAKAALASWISLGAMYQTFERSYSGLTPASTANQQVLKDNYPEVLTTTSAFLELSRQF